MTRFRLAALALAGFLLAAPAPALAQPAGANVVTLGQHTAWTSHYYTDAQGNRVCFVISRPTGSTPQTQSRGQPYLFVTYWPGGVRGEVMVSAGYTFQAGTPVTLIVGNASYRFFTQPAFPDTAWIENPAQEAALVTAMRNGSTLTVRGTSAQGTETNDTYSLIGITAALNQIATQCPA